jgi:transcriptional regulator with XRE-family HTH domain
MPRSTSAPQAAGLSARLREARTRAGIPTAELATSIGVHPKTIERWSRSDDHATIPTGKLLALAGVLDVDPTWLLVGQAS